MAQTRSEALADFDSYLESIEQAAGTARCDAITLPDARRVIMYTLMGLVSALASADTQIHNAEE